MELSSYKVTDPNDKHHYEFCEFIGTEKDCLKFIQDHREDKKYDFISKVPYFYENGNYRVTYWKRK